KGAAGRRRIVEHFTTDQMGERMVELFHKAQEFASASPRPAVAKGLGLESTILAIEYARLDEQAEELQSPIRRSRFWRLGQRAVETLPGWLIYEAVHAIARRLGHRQSRYWQSEYEDLDTNL
nr:hypothetical protein [Anaerolineae bacterium]NIN93584.1 hypothetical protein [Anaerolineae bacterium]NIQ76670.1 hypothetical protein [Anaerolineae bacterium]